MSSTVTVRDIDPADKAWLKREARQGGVSMEEFIRRLIREKRAKAEHRATPSEAFRRYFGPEHGVELPEARHLKTTCRTPFSRQRRPDAASPSSRET